MTRADVSALLEPYEDGSLRLRNRIVMAPMTRCFSPGGVPGPDVARYYARRASSVGLIITEGVLIDHPSAGSVDAVPRLYGQAPLAGWRRVTDAVHEAGGRIAAQLWHVGLSRDPAGPLYPGYQALSPSGIDGSRLTLAGWTRRLSGLPTIAVGGVGVPPRPEDPRAVLPETVPPTEKVADAAAAIEAGEFDLMAVGRALLTDPDWAAELSDGRTAKMTAYRKSDEDLLDGIPRHTSRP